MTEVNGGTPAMQLLTVGQPYDPGRRMWPEGADYNFRAGTHELRIFLTRATAAEVAAAQEGKIDFGLLIDLPELYIVSRFFDPRDPTRRVMAFDCSYSIHRIAAADRTPPPATEEISPALRSLVSVILIEATTGVVLAFRALTYSPEFTRAIHRAIADQLALPYDQATHEREAVAKIAALDTHQLWDACKIRCTGGAD
jgi:hypothetical protein